jgi:putative tryptophan/tyrosine transport system substrate-binding protein
VLRRRFMTLLGGTVAMDALRCPLAARAQQGERVRRIGVLMHLPESDREGQDRFGAFLRELKRLGWIDGQNTKLDTRWGASDSDRRRQAGELVALAPDVILASTSLAMVALQAVTTTVPIVFANVADPVGAGFVPSLAQPRGNVTGFMLFDYTMSAKWLELLKEIAPRVTRAVVIRDPTSPAAIGQFAVIQSAARSLGMEVTPAGVHDAAEIEHAIKTFLRPEHGGIVVTGSAVGVAQRDLFVSLAARHRVPAIYPFRYFVSGGGLVSYGPDTTDQYRQAAGYVDRILKGEKPGNLPVQASTKYDLVINLKTAKALGLELPPTMRARAQELIEA